MYDTTFECRYNRPDVFLESDQLTDHDKDVVRDVLFKEDMLNIFDMDEFDETTINTKLAQLYDKICTNTQLSNCMKCVASRFLSDELFTGLMILYSYDYMHYTHDCVAEYLTQGTISENTINALKTAINYVDVSCGEIHYEDYEENA